MGEAVKSVLHAEHEARGAQFVVYSGWTWVTTFGDVQREYEAIRSGVSMWDVYGLQKFEVTGPDSATAIQRVFGNDVLGMAVGQVKYGPFVTDRGALIDDGTVFKLADDHFWVMANSESTEHYIRDNAGGLDTRVEFRTHHMPDISIQGPGARDFIQRLTTTDISGLRHFRFLPDRIEVAGIPVWITRSGFTGDLGYELIPDPENAVVLWRLLANEGAVPVGVDAVGIARIEAGLVIIGNDYEPGETSPYDLSMDKVVASDKDLPMLGIEILRETAVAPPRRFKTLRVPGSVLPADMTPVWSGERRVGTLTSPSNSPLAGVIGLAVLDTEWATNGTHLTIEMGDTAVTVVVDELSIFDPQRSRQRG